MLLPLPMPQQRDHLEPMPWALRLLPSCQCAQPDRARMAGVRNKKKGPQYYKTEELPHPSPAGGGGLGDLANLLDHHVVSETT